MEWRYKVLPVEHQVVPDTCQSQVGGGLRVASPMKRWTSGAQWKKTLITIFMHKHHPFKAHRSCQQHQTVWFKNQLACQGKLFLPERNGKFKTQKQRWGVFFTSLTKRVLEFYYNKYQTFGLTWLHKWRLVSSFQQGARAQAAMTTPLTHISQMKTVGKAIQIN